jgi:hypothetical protein
MNTSTPYWLMIIWSVNLEKKILKWRKITPVGYPIIKKVIRQTSDSLPLLLYRATEYTHI